MKPEPLLMQRFAAVFLGDTPTPAAQCLFDAAFHTEGTSCELLSIEAAAAFELLSVEEQRLVKLDELIKSMGSEECAETWVRLALVIFRKRQCLPAVPQPGRDDGLLAAAGAASGGRVLHVVGGAYVPKGTGASKHLATSEAGGVNAASFKQIERAAQRHIERSGVPITAGTQLTLVGDIAHWIIDACPGVVEVKIGKGERVDAEKLCREDCTDPVVHAAMVAYFTACLNVAKGKGFERAELALFSKPSRYVEPLFRKACEPAGLELTTLTLSNGATWAFHPETLLKPSSNNCRASETRHFDEMVKLMLNPTVRGLGCTPFNGDGYAYTLVSEYSSFTDEEKAERSAATNPHNVAKAAEAVADAAVVAAEAEDAPAEAAGHAAAAVNAATEKRKRAQAASDAVSLGARGRQKRARDARAATIAAASTTTPEVDSSVEHGQSPLFVSLPVPGPSETKVAYADAEDEQIWNHVATNGTGKWKDLEKQLPGRTYKSVSSRWHNASGHLLLEKTRLMEARNAGYSAGGYRRETTPMTTPRYCMAIDNDGNITGVWA